MVGLIFTIYGLIVDKIGNSLNPMNWIKNKRGKGSGGVTKRGNVYYIKEGSILGYMIGAPFAGLHCISVSLIALGRVFGGFILAGSLLGYVGYSTYQNKLAFEDYHDSID